MNSVKCLSDDDASIKAKSEVLQSPEKKVLRPRNNLIPGIFQEQKRTYIKVPQEIKEQLFQLVFKEGFKIKQVLYWINNKLGCSDTFYQICNSQDNHISYAQDKSKIKEKKMQFLQIYFVIEEDLHQIKNYFNYIKRANFFR